MKLQVEGIRCGDCARHITHALLRLDLGARINFPDSHQVRIEGRLTLDEAARAIEQTGFRIAAVLDGTTLDTGARAAS